MKLTAKIVKPFQEASRHNFQAETFHLDEFSEDLKKLTGEKYFLRNFGDF
jgi:hypothetical protein